MVQVEWSDSAFEQLSIISSHISRFNPPAAERMVRRIVDATRRLEAFPQSGRIVPEHQLDSVREIIVRPYRVVYRVRDEVVEIVTVRHGARRLDDLPDS